MSTTSPDAAAPLPDQGARDYAIDPRHNVVLEASAGTGKTSVLVRRYLALLDVGVAPGNILAITFTRKAAAEMRERIIGELKRRAAQSEDGRRQWRQLRERLGDVAISTIDAFCLALLGEFPLEADLDPGFGVADDTETAVLLEGTLERALLMARARLADQEGVRLLLAQVPQRRLLRGLGRLIERRVIAHEVLSRVLARVPPDLTMDAAVRDAATRVAGALTSAPGGVLAFVNDRPAMPRFDLLQADITLLLRGQASTADLRSALAGIREHFLGQDGRPRQRVTGVLKREFPSPQAWTRHQAALQAAAPRIAEAFTALERDTTAVIVRGLRQVHGTAVSLYRRALHEADRVDFTEALARTVALLANMDEFAQSRYRLQSRYHHVLVDEFQDTNRLQWRLVSLLVEAWGEGYGLVHEAPVPPTIFIVGDRKQSIYRFRDADVTILRDAVGFVGNLRPGDRPRRVISTSFRSRPELLAFVNDLCSLVARASDRADAFVFGAEDTFPLLTAPTRASDPDPPLGCILTGSDREAAEVIADEIARVLREVDVRDRQTGVMRGARPGDIAVLFRARASHRACEAALEARGIPTYVYKGLGFFDAEEIQDLVALIRFLARPSSGLRLAAVLRSRLIGVSDAALMALSDGLVEHVLGSLRDPRVDHLDEPDRIALELLREAVPRWLARVDREPPDEVIDAILRETGYASELAGVRAAQARENVKKLRMLVRRLGNRGYLTMSRLADHLARLSAGDESNAIVDAADAVNLMTVHAAKGLEFPVVFVVDLGRGTGGAEPIRVMADDGRGEPLVAIAGVTTAAEDHQREAESEEAKRLLYVALTRARDRLYLAGTLRKGRLHAARGSLAEALPPEFTAFLLSTASRPADEREADWSGPGGRRHRFLRLSPAPAEPTTPD